MVLILAVNSVNYYCIWLIVSFTKTLNKQHYYKIKVLKTQIYKYIGFIKL